MIAAATTLSSLPNRGLAAPLLNKVCQAANWMIATDPEGNQFGVFQRT